MSKLIAIFVRDVHPEQDKLIEALKDTANNVYQPEEGDKLVIEFGEDKLPVFGLHTSFANEKLLERYQCPSNMEVEAEALTAQELFNKELLTFSCASCTGCKKETNRASQDIN